MLFFTHARSQTRTSRPVLDRQWHKAPWDEFPSWKSRSGSSVAHGDVQTRRCLVPSLLLSHLPQPYQLRCKGPQSRCFSREWLYGFELCFQTPWLIISQPLEMFTLYWQLTQSGGEGRLSYLRARKHARLFSDSRTCIEASTNSWTFGWVSSLTPLLCLKKFHSALQNETVKSLSLFIFSAC